MNRATRSTLLVGCLAGALLPGCVIGGLEKVGSSSSGSANSSARSGGTSSIDVSGGAASGGSSGVTSPPAAGSGGTQTGNSATSGGSLGMGGISGSSGDSTSGGDSAAGSQPANGGSGNAGGLGGLGGSPGVAGMPLTSGGTLGTGGRAGTAGSTPGSGGTIASAGGVLGNGGATGGVGAGGVPGVCAPPATGHYQMEDLDRGVIAAKIGAGVYVGWRMMGYEYDATNPTNIAYNLYRDGTKVATVTDSTNYVDANGTSGSTYAVSAVIGGTECARSEPVGTWAENYLTIPLTPPASGYTPNDASTGDLDGDGRLDIVLKWDPPTAFDNSQAGITEDVYIDGYSLAGTRLFRINLGPNIRAGAHYTQMSVYDFDGDGKAELAVKTAPGTVDGAGAYLQLGPAATDDDSTLYRNAGGYILSGPEYLTVFRGTDGAELATVDYPVPRGTVADWGDTYGNRVDRFNGGIAFVRDGAAVNGRPSIIQQRGYYTRMTVSALYWRNGILSTNWIFDSNAASNGSAAGQGNHQLMAADTDNDGAQEIITGASTIASDGTLQCTTGLGHGDAMHVSELIKGSGISVFTVHEGGSYGHDVHNAATCAFFINTPGNSDNGRGVAEWINSTNTTAATCTSNVGSMNCQTGTAITSSAGNNFVIYWDGNESRELENLVSITLEGGTVLLEATGCASNNGTKSTPTLTADLLGDWREEIIFRTADNMSLRVYTTTTVTARRLYTLMHDPTYRAQVSFENSAYNQPPHTGFHIGAGMAAPPKPDIYVR